MDKCQLGFRSVCTAAMISPLNAASSSILIKSRSVSVPVGAAPTTGHGVPARRIVCPSVTAAERGLVVASILSGAGGCQSIVRSPSSKKRKKKERTSENNFWSELFFSVNFFLFLEEEKRFAAS